MSSINLADFTEKILKFLNICHSFYIGFFHQMCNFHTPIEILHFCTFLSSFLTFKMCKFIKYKNYN